jgi:uncharacterized protein
MGEEYFVIDIETCPIDMDSYNKLDEEERKKLLNPIDSKIVAIGIRYNFENIIISRKNEKEILVSFWNKWKELKKNITIKIVGFNVKNFDLPFIVSRSFIHNVSVSSFLLKDIIDIREKINAYRYGKTRGTLKDYAKLIGCKIMDVDGSDVFSLFCNKKYDEIDKYLANDLEITDKLYLRAKETNILHIDRW